MSTSTSATDPMRLAQPLVIDERIKQVVPGAVAEIDPAQTALARTFAPAQAGLAGVIDDSGNGKSQCLSLVSKAAGIE